MFFLFFHFISNRFGGFVNLKLRQTNYVNANLILNYKLFKIHRFKRRRNFGIFQRKIFCVFFYQNCSTPFAFRITRHFLFSNIVSLFLLLFPPFHLTSSFICARSETQYNTMLFLIFQFLINSYIKVFFFGRFIRLKLSCHRKCSSYSFSARILYFRTYFHQSQFSMFGCANAKKKVRV